MARNRTRGIGEIVSTIAFFGMSAWIALEALSLIGSVSKVQIYGLFAASFMCLLGGLRFVIAEIVRIVATATKK